MDDETERLVKACEEAWFWYCQSANQKMNCRPGGSQLKALEVQLFDDRLNHERARKALSDHLDRMSRQWMSDAGCTLPRIEDEG